ncbi:histidinol-phosphate transaminase [Aquibacillus sediminis]|uniref:histidinol-phosphate transaminase n=1 Tax=Aquibacillus sediminis TaxID=2574734 RepID=UPI001109D34C|nr:histidinol-phosphate transaminase [Aquibacillus sediminis]
MQAKQVFNGMSPYKPGKQIEDVKKEYGLENIVKLASNENPFGYSPKVRQAIPDLIHHLEIYPDGYATALRESLSEKLGVDGEQLVFGCGSDEVVDLICRTYLEPGTKIITATPTFPQYKHNALIQGASVVEAPLTEGYHDLDGMLAKIDEETKVVWLCTPNNPTGCVINQTQFDDFMDRCPSDVLVVVDEAYYEYVQTEDYPDSIKALEEYENLIVLRTFSKAYGLAGLRVGYGVATKEVANVLNITRGPFNTTTIAQGAAMIALEDQQFLQDSIQKNGANKANFLAFCKEAGLEYYDSQTNFVFVTLPTSGDALCDYLLSKGFIVRSGEALGHPKGVRITIGKQNHMEELQQLISDFLETHKEETK